MSFVGFCSNSSVSPSSSDPNLYTPSAPGYVCDGPAWPINPGNSAFNGITLSVDEESCRSPWCKTVSFFFFFLKRKRLRLPGIAYSRRSLSALLYNTQSRNLFPPSCLWQSRRLPPSPPALLDIYHLMNPLRGTLSRYKLTNHLLRRCGQSGRSKTKLLITYHLVESSNQGLPIFLDSKWLTAAMATRTLFR